MMMNREKKIVTRKDAMALKDRRRRIRVVLGCTCCARAARR